MNRRELPLMRRSACRRRNMFVCLAKVKQQSPTRLLVVYTRRSQRYARRLGYCLPDTPTFDELCDTADDEL